MTATLGSVCQFLNGGTPSKAVGEYFEGDIPWITSADISGPIASYARSFITEGAIRNSAVNKVPAGSVLLVTRTGVGKVAVTQTELCFSQDITAVIPDRAKLDTGYLVHYLRTKKSYFERLARGATIKGITRDVVSDLSIPLPPLPEQRRIAAILDQADALRTKRREALAQLDRLTQAIFVEMFGDPTSNPKGLPFKALTEICHCYSGGTPSKANESFWLGELPWFTPKDIKQSDLFDSKDHISAEIPRTSALKLLPRDTVVIVVRGMILAHTFPVSVLRVPATINQDLKALISYDPMDSQFLAYCLRVQEKFILEQVSEAAHGTKRLDVEALSKIKIPTVSLNRQNEFSVRSHGVEKLKTAFSKSLAELDTLFTSLQHQAFRGEL